MAAVGPRDVFDFDGQRPSDNESMRSTESTPMRISEFDTKALSTWRRTSARVVISGAYFWPDIDLGS